MSKFDPARFGAFVGRRVKELLVERDARIAEQLKVLPALQEQVTRLDERFKALQDDAGAKAQIAALTKRVKELEAEQHQ